MSIDAIYASVSDGTYDSDSDGMIGDEELPTSRVIGDDFHAARSVFTDVSTPAPAPTPFRS